MKQTQNEKQVQNAAVQFLNCRAEILPDSCAARSNVLHYSLISGIIEQEIEIISSIFVGTLKRAARRW